MLGYLKAAIFDCIEETNMQEVLTGLRDKFYFTDDMLNESKQRMLNQRKERAISRKVTNIMRKQPAF